MSFLRDDPVPHYVVKRREVRAAFGRCGLSLPALPSSPGGPVGLLWACGLCPAVLPLDHRPGLGERGNPRGTSEIPMSRPLSAQSTQPLPAEPRHRYFELPRGSEVRPDCEPLLWCHRGTACSLSSQTAQLRGASPCGRGLALCGRRLSGTWAGAGTWSVDSACGDGRVELPGPSRQRAPRRKGVPESSSQFWVSVHVPEGVVCASLSPLVHRGPSRSRVRCCGHASSCAKTLSDIKIGAHERVNLV